MSSRSCGLPPHSIPLIPYSYSSPSETDSSHEKSLKNSPKHLNDSTNEENKYTQVVIFQLENTNKTNVTEKDSSDSSKKLFPMRKKSLSHSTLKRSTSEKTDAFVNDSLANSHSSAKVTEPLIFSSQMKLTHESPKKTSGLNSLNSLSSKNLTNQIPTPNKTVLEMIQECNDFLLLLEKVLPGNFQIFKYGDSLKRNLQEIHKEELKEKEASKKKNKNEAKLKAEFKQKLDNSATYQIYLKMTELVIQIQKEKTCNELLEFIMTEEKSIISTLDLNLNNAMTEAAIALAKKNNSQKNYKEILIKEIYLQAFLKMALEEREEIFNKLPKNLPNNLNIPEYLILKKIADKASKLYVCAKPTQLLNADSHDLKSYKTIFIHFISAVKNSLPTDLPNSEESLSLSAYPAIQCFLQFFKKKIFELQEILFLKQLKDYKKQQFAIYENLNNILQNLKNKSFFITNTLEEIISILEKEVKISDQLKIKNNKYSYQALYLIYQIVNELNNTNEIKSLKNGDHLKSRLDSLRITLNTSADSTSTKEEGSESLQEIDKSTKRKTIISKFGVSKSTKRKGLSRENSCYYFPCPSSLPFKNSFYPDLILNPLVPYLTKEKFLNVFEFFMKYQIEKHPAEILFEHLKIFMPNAELYIKNEVLLLIKAWLLNPFVNLKYSPNYAKNTIEQIKLILEAIKSSSLIFDSQIDEINTLLKKYRNKKSFFTKQLNDSKKTIQKFSFTGEDVSSYANALREISYKSFKEVSSSGWDINFHQIKANQQNPLKKHTNFIICLVLKEFSTHSYKDVSNLFNFFVEVIEDLINKNKSNFSNSDQSIILETSVQSNEVMQSFELESLPMGAEHSQKMKANHIGIDSSSKDCITSLPSTAVSRIMDLCSAKSIYTALNIISNHYPKETEIFTKRINEINFQKLHEQNQKKLLIPALFSLKAYFEKNILLSGNQFGLMEQLLEIFEVISFQQRQLKLIQKNNYSFNILKTSISYNFDFNIKKFIDSFKLNHYIETLLLENLLFKENYLKNILKIENLDLINVFDFKEKLLSVFKLFITLKKEENSHIEIFMKILIQKFIDSNEENRKIKICEIISNLFLNPIHFAKDKKSFEEEKKLISPRIKKLISLLKDSQHQNKIFSNTIRNLNNWLEFNFKELESNPTSLGSPYQLIESIANGTIGNEHEEAYKIAVNNIAATLTQTSLLLYKKLNSSDFATNPCNSPNVDQLFVHYSKVSYWIKGLIIDQANKSKSFLLFKFFLNVIIELIDKKDISKSNPADFGSAIAVAGALFSPFMYKFSNEIKDLQKYKKIFDVANFRLLRKACKAKKFIIYPVNLVTKDFMHFQEQKKQNHKASFLLLEGSFTFLTNLLSPLSYLIHSPEIEIFDIDSIFKEIYKIKETTNDEDVKKNIEIFNDNLNDRARTKLKNEEEINK
jgi:hypothetical protein